MPDLWLRPLRDVLATGDFLRLSNIYIAGLEVSQAIQHCNASEHLTDPSDRGPDNSIMLVADKPAMVRVFVRTLFARLNGVIGTITVQRRRRSVWVDSGALTQQWPPAITAQPDLAYNLERGRLGSSLNFLIPAAEMRGRLRLQVKVEVPGSNYRDSDELEIIASLTQTLRIRGIPVRYQGPDPAGNQVDLAAPTLADFQTTAVTALAMFPVSHVPDISLAGTFTWSQPLTGAITTSDGSAQCPTSWEDLLFWLGIAKIIDGNRADRLYYALLPTGIPTGGAGGCGGGGAVGGGFNAVARTMAHELGHVLGLDHAPCGLATGDNGDVNYPAYQPYDSESAKMASIGEYGIDVDIPRVHDPSTTRDFMSYCGPRWISPYHYRKLLEHPSLDPRWIATLPYELPPYEYDWPPRLPVPDPGWDRRRFQDNIPPLSRHFVVTGLLRNARIEIQSALRLTTRATNAATVVDGAFAELLDGRGNVLERVPLMLSSLQACSGCSPWCKCGEGKSPRTGLVQAFLPDRDDARAVHVVWRNEEVWSRKASRVKPVVRNLRGKNAGDRLDFRWESRVAEGHPLERALRWSDDGGEEWQVLAVRLDRDEADLPVEALPSGDILVQAIVSDGFATAVSEVVEVRVPARKPTVSILWPRASFALPAGNQVRFWGVGAASDGRHLAGEDLQWELDGAAAGSGTEVWADVSDCSGEHTLVLRARDGRRVAEATTTFTAREVDRE